jgi:hypothetical protein
MRLGTRLIVQRKCSTAVSLIVSLLTIFGSTRMALAADDVTVADLQAAVRAIGFLDHLPGDGTIIVGVVYASQYPSSKALATLTAGLLSTLPGPNKSTIRAKLVPLETLVQANDRLDAVFLMPGMSAEAPAIVEAIRRRHILSISSDPACLETNCCVLMVRANPEVEIVLNSALAEAVGADFSTVFAMIVKRK